MTDDYVKVDGSSSLVRDKTTGAVLNTDKSALAAARMRKQSLKEEKERLVKLENDVFEIKSMLKALLNKDNT